MRIRQQLVASTKNVSTAPNARRYVTVHDTGNTGRGANAAAHANLQSRPNPRLASWHWTVDDNEAVQSFLHRVRSFHAGTARGNREAISVEICVNSDGDYSQAVRNGAELVARILKEEGLGLDDVVQHHFWSGKNCPTGIRGSRGGLSWAVFMSLVSTFLRGGGAVTPPVTEVPTYGRILPAHQEMLELLGFYDGTTFDGTHGPISIAGAKAFQEAHGLKVDGIVGPFTITKLEKEYDMAVKEILAAIADSEKRQSAFVDTRIDQLAGWTKNIEAALEAWRVADQPDGVGVQVGQIFTKLARKDLEEIHFRLEEGGPWCVAWRGTGAWAICPSEDIWKRHNGVLDHLKLSKTRNVATWEEISGVKGSLVAEPLAFGRQVEWARLTEAPSSVDPDVVEA